MPTSACTRAPSGIGSSSSTATSSRYETGYAPGCDERVAAPHLRALDAREADRDALPCFGPIDVAIVNLDAPDAHRSSRRLEAQLVAGADRPGPERPGHDGADSAKRERAVDVEAGRAVGAGFLDLVRDRRDGCAQVVEPRSGLRADGDDLGSGNELARLLDHELERLRVDRVRLRHRDDAALDPEQPQDREVLVRLWPSALARVDDEQEEVDAGRARDHRPHEALVARHVDDGEPAPVRELERRVAEVDRDPAPLLFRQPVGVLSGQRPHEPRLPMVDVTGGPDRERHQRRLIMSRHGFCSQSPWISSSATKPRAS